MTQCSYSIDHQPHGALRCAAPAEHRAQRCPEHRRASRGGVGPSAAPGGEVVLIARDGCLVWDELARYHDARRGRRAAELFSGGARPLAWINSVGLWVDVAAWMFLLEHGRPRPAGTFQRCGRAGCVDPDHAMEPRRRVGAPPIDVSTPLDRRFGLGAA